MFIPAVYPVNGFWSGLLCCRCSEDSVALKERTRSGCCSKRMPRLRQDLAFLYPEALERERENTSYGFRNMRQEIFPPQISLLYSPVFKETYYTKKKKNQTVIGNNRRNRAHYLN